MKKSLFVFGVISVASVAAVAKTIDLDTQIKWNSGVVETALTKSGFIASSNANWDVRVTSERILAELLKRETFSVRDATAVCLDKCNMSDFLKNGRGQSGKKCPELCTDFADALVTVNNESIDSGIMSPQKQDLSLNNLEGTPENVCRELTKKAQGQGLSLPMLCGGQCYRFGDDKIIVTDYDTTIEYEVDDFCDGDGISKENSYWFIVSSTGLEDVSGYSQENRLKRLKNAQTQPIANYKAEQVRKERERAKQEYEQRMQENSIPYDRQVQKHGYCPYQDMRVAYVKTSLNCKREARKFAQANACKIARYTEIGQEDLLSVDGRSYISGCEINGKTESQSGTHSWYDVKTYEYTPSYKDCVATFNEAKCNAVAEGYDILY